MGQRLLFLGVDGGGTRCRARLVNSGGAILGESVAGPANIRINLEESVRSVMAATGHCLAQAGASFPDRSDTIVACLALAGASEPKEAATAQAAFETRFRRVVVATDAHAACVGAHGGEDGGVIIVGTGSIGWAVRGGRSIRVGGWGFPVSDEGSGAWIGWEAVRRTLLAHDGRAAWTPLLTEVSQRFGADPHAIVAWTGSARPRDFGRLAPLVLDHAARADIAAREVMRLAARHIDAIAARLAEHGTTRLALMGGLAAGIEPWLAPATRVHLVPPAGDALDGALRLARGAVGRSPAAPTLEDETVTAPQMRRDPPPPCGEGLGVGGTTVLDCPEIPPTLSLPQKGGDPAAHLSLNRPLVRVRPLATTSRQNLDAGGKGSDPVAGDRSTPSTESLP